MGRKSEWNVYRRCAHCRRWYSLGSFQNGTRRTCAQCYRKRVDWNVSRIPWTLTDKARRAIVA